MPTSTFPSTVTGVTVETATAGALSGDGSSGDKLAVEVDGVTITVNGSNELVGASHITIGDTQVAYATAANTIGGSANLTYETGAKSLSFRSGAFLDLFTSTDTAVGYTIQRVNGGSSGGVDALVFENLWDGATSLKLVGSNNYLEATGSLYVLTAGDRDIVIHPGNGGLSNANLGLQASGTGVIYISANAQIGDGLALQTDTTTGHTALLQAYDVDGTAYKTFGTLTNGNTPSFVIGPPSGGTVTVQATTFKSSDGTSGATAGPFTVITAITVKNGLVTALTGS